LSSSPTYKCLNQGELTFEYADGRVRKVLFFQGHEDEYYEFAVGEQFFRTERSKVIEVAIAMGMGTDDLPR
jgi:hypothetical protein